MSKRHHPPHVRRPETQAGDANPAVTEVVVEPTPPGTDLLDEGSSPQEPEHEPAPSPSEVEPLPQTVQARVAVMLEQQARQSRDIIKGLQDRNAELERALEQQSQQFEQAWAAREAEWSRQNTTVETVSSAGDAEEPPRAVRAVAAPAVSKRVGPASVKASAVAAKPSSSAKVQVIARRTVNTQIGPERYSFSAGAKVQVRQDHLDHLREKHII